VADICLSLVLVLRTELVTKFVVNDSMRFTRYKITYSKSWDADRLAVDPRQVRDTAEMLMGDVERVVVKFNVIPTIRSARVPHLTWYSSETSTEGYMTGLAGRWGIYHRSRSHNKFYSSCPHCPLDCPGLLQATVNRDPAALLPFTQETARSRQKFTPRPTPWTRTTRAQDKSSNSAPRQCFFFFFERSAQVGRSLRR